MMALWELRFIPSFARGLSGENSCDAQEEDYVKQRDPDRRIRLPRILFVHILPNILPALLVGADDRF